MSSSQPLAPQERIYPQYFHHTKQKAQSYEDFVAWLKRHHHYEKLSPEDLRTLDKDYQDLMPPPEPASQPGPKVKKRKFARQDDTPITPNILGPINILSNTNYNYTVERQQNAFLASQPADCMAHAGTTSDHGEESGNLTAEFFADMFDGVPGTNVCNHSASNSQVGNTRDAVAEDHRLEFPIDESQLPWNFEPFSQLIQTPREMKTAAATAALNNDFPSSPPVVRQQSESESIPDTMVGSDSLSQDGSALSSYCLNPVLMRGLYEPFRFPDSAILDDMVVSRISNEMRSEENAKSIELQLLQYGVLYLNKATWLDTPRRVHLWHTTGFKAKHPKGFTDACDEINELAKRGFRYELRGEDDGDNDVYNWFATSVRHLMSTGQKTQLALLRNQYDLYRLTDLWSFIPKRFLLYHDISIEQQPSEPARYNIKCSRSQAILGAIKYAPSSAHLEAGIPELAWSLYHSAVEIVKVAPEKRLTSLRYVGIICSPSEIIVFTLTPLSQGLSCLVHGEVKRLRREDYVSVLAVVDVALQLFKQQVELYKDLFPSMPDVIRATLN